MLAPQLSRIHEIFADMGGTQIPAILQEYFYTWLFSPSPLCIGDQSLQAPCLFEFTQSLSKVLKEYYNIRNLKLWLSYTSATVLTTS